MKELVCLAIRDVATYDNYRHLSRKEYDCLGGLNDQFYVLSSRFRST